MPTTTTTRAGRLEVASVGVSHRTRYRLESQDVRAWSRPNTALNTKTTQQHLDDATRTIAGCWLESARARTSCRRSKRAEAATRPAVAERCRSLSVRLVVAAAAVAVAAAVVVAAAAVTFKFCASLPSFTWWWAG